MWPKSAAPCPAMDGPAPGLGCVAALHLDDCVEHLLVGRLLGLEVGVLERGQHLARLGDAAAAGEQVEQVEAKRASSRAAAPPTLPRRWPPAAAARPRPGSPRQTTRLVWVRPSGPSGGRPECSRHQSRPCPDVAPDAMASSASSRAAGTPETSIPTWTSAFMSRAWERTSGSSPHSDSALSMIRSTLAMLPTIPSSIISQAVPRSRPTGSDSISRLRKSVSSLALAGIRQPRRPGRARVACAAAEPSGVRASASSASSTPVSTAPRAAAVADSDDSSSASSSVASVVPSARWRARLSAWVPSSASSRCRPALAGRRRALARRGREQRVPGPHPPALGDGDQPVAHRRLDGLEPDQLHERVLADVGVERDGEQQGALLLGQVADPEPEHRGHLFGHAQRLADVGDPALDEHPPDLEREQRVAARLLVHHPEHARRDHQREVLVQQSRGLVDATAAGARRSAGADAPARPRADSGRSQPGGSSRTAPTPPPAAAPRSSAPRATWRRPTARRR